MKTKMLMTNYSIIAAALIAVVALAAFAADTQPPAKPDAGNAAVPTVEVRLLDANGKLGPKTAVPRVIKTDAEWKKQLTPAQYQIARAKGTEPAFCGAFYDQHKPGVYYCVCCGLPLFTSETKYNSGTGWPSFFQPIAQENVITHIDRSHGMERTESLCARCDCHLGHIFDDGPRPTGLRFCMNSASLVFKEDKHFKDGSAKK